MNDYDAAAYKAAKRLSEIFLFLDVDDNNAISKKEMETIY